MQIYIIPEIENYKVLPMNYANIRTLLEPFAGGTIHVGFSGGADSFAALLTVLAAALLMSLVRPPEKPKRKRKGKDA